MESDESLDRLWASLEDTEAAESPTQGQIINATQWSVNELARQRGWEVVVGSHTFFAWDKDDPAASIAPDLYLVDGPQPALDLWVWMAWKPDFRRPRWALEVVSWDWRKEYVENLPKYAQLRCSELVFFDPMLLMRLSTDGEDLRKPLTIFRLGKDGKLHRFYSGDGPAYSRQLKVWLATGREGNQPMLRLWLDKAGTKVVPNDDEARAEYARVAEEQARRDEELARRDEELARRDEELALRDEELARRDEELARRDEEHARRADELKRR